MLRRMRAVAVLIVGILAVRSAHAETCNRSSPGWCGIVARHFMADTGSGVRRADDTTIVTFPFRYGLVAKNFYALAEIEMGIIADHAPRIVRPPGMTEAVRSEAGAMPVDTVSADMSAAGYLVAGLRGDIGAVAVSAELAAGGRMFTNSAEHLNGSWRGLVEGRVRGERMVSEHVGVGAWVGTSVLGATDWSAGLQSVYRFGGEK